MEFLKKRQTAIIIFIVVVIAFSLFSAHRSINKLCRNAEQAFFEKGALTDYDYYTVPYDHLENALNYANRLLSVINNSDELSEYYSAVLTDRQALSDAMAGGSISSMYDAAAALNDDITALDAVVQSGVTLPQSNDDYSDIMTSLTGALRAAMDSPYNQYIDDFSADTLKNFPTNILRAVSFVSAPEKFA